MNRIQSKSCSKTHEISNIFLSCFDDKICIQNNEYDGLALGYYSYLLKKVILITIKKKFFVKQIVLIFSVLGASFLLSKVF